MATESFTFQEIEADAPSGLLSGVWSVPSGGFVWRDNLAPLSREGPRGYSLDPTDQRRWWLRARRPAGEERVYPVLGKRKLLDEFLDVARRPDRRAISKFASDWGLLTSGFRAAAFDDVDSRFTAEPLDFWQRELADLLRLSDTLKLIRIVDLGGSYPVEEAVGADRALRERASWLTDRDGLTYEGRFVDGRIRFVARLGASPGADQVIEATRPRPGRGGKHLPGKHVELARRYVHSSVNRRMLASFDPVVRLNGDLRFYPRDLLAAIDLLFALELTGGKPGERPCGNPKCPEPGRVFYPHDKRMRYCSDHCRKQAWDIENRSENEIEQVFEKEIKKAKEARHGGASG